mmetsp:Transcript_48081/g.93920  ORF Transcript_48081/g.93920 Transcript_48081/m.93920 type:complete len:80 (-) Transcript_48081:398-637(-)
MSPCLQISPSPLTVSFQSGHEEGQEVKRGGKRVEGGAPGGVKQGANMSQGGSRSIITCLINYIIKAYYNLFRAWRGDES